METFVMNRLENHEFDSDAIVESTLFHGFGIGAWNILVTPRGENMKIQYVHSKITGAQDGEPLYKVVRVLETKWVKVTGPLVIKLGNRNQGWWVQVTPRPIWELAEEKGVNVRMVRNVHTIASEQKAADAATEWLPGNWFRVHSYKWSEPIKGFRPEEAQYRGHYRGIEANGLNGYWGEYIFSRSVDQERIIEFLRGLK